MNRIARICTTFLFALQAALLACSPARAQGLEVTPTNVLLAPGQTAAALTVANHEDHKVSFQIRGFAWRQDGQGNDILEPSDALLASPPIATIEPGASQVVRLILRQPPQGQEATYRILFDQLPPPHEAGVVRILLRLSIPVFSEPQTQVAPRLHWRIANENGRWWLIVTNDGNRHLTLGNLKLVGPDQRELQVDVRSPPHILAGATRRWPIATTATLLSKDVVRLTATADVGTIDERIFPDSGP
jgi:fimbrial chaperone protein